MGNLFVAIDVNKDGKAYIAGIFPSLKLLKDKGFKDCTIAIIDSNIEEGIYLTAEFRCLKCGNIQKVA